MGRLLTLFIPFMISAPLFSAPVKRNIEYGRVGNTALLLDACQPDGDGPFPAVIIVHGGGWIGGHREYSVQPLFEPLTKAGFAWFSISYRLATNVMQLGVAVQDVQTSIDHIRANARAYNIDPERIAVLGESAGAHLASLAVERSPKDVAAVVALYPPSDLVSLVRNARAIPDSLRQAVKAFGMEEVILSYLREMSPIEHIKPGLPPFLLVHGTQDRVVPYDQSTQMLMRLRDNGVDAELITVDGGGHGLRGWEMSTLYSAYRAKVIDWLRVRLKQATQAY
jgi:acetyl esterase